MKKNLFILAAILCCSGCASNFAVMTTNENLSALTKITDSEDPCFDPEGGDYGKNLFFTIAEDGKWSNIYKKDNVLVGAVSPKTSGHNHHQSPTYCDTLQRMAFTYWGESSRQFEIYSMDANQGKALSQVVESVNSTEKHPSYAPNGEWLAYAKYPYIIYGNIDERYVKPQTLANFYRQHELWIKNLNTGESILLGKGLQPAFSPDSKQIAFVRFAEDGKSSDIWIMAADGSNAVQITNGKGYAQAPKWSPDGHKIIFQMSTKDKPDHDLYVIGTNGENLTQFTLNKSSDIQPVWTKDNYIYFSSDRGSKPRNYQIWRFKMD